ncbi:N-ATPase subunit AtpR [Rhodobacter sp. NSM]|uniref:N-ATPase subunit AtpR n=1 Tax=Rhodobacter sp. NSM TaxID=3457501 RepID=UPI003FD4BC7D
MTVLLALAALAAGAMAGWLHFRSLRIVSDRLLRGDLTAVTLQLARLGLLAGFLVLCSRGGALPLIAGAAGVLAGRAIVLRRERAE